MSESDVGFGCRNRMSDSDVGFGCRIRMSDSESDVGIGCRNRMSESESDVGIGCRNRMSESDVGIGIGIGCRNRMSDSGSDVGIGCRNRNRMSESESDVGIGFGFGCRILRSKSSGAGHDDRPRMSKDSRSGNRVPPRPCGPRSWRGSSGPFRRSAPRTGLRSGQLYPLSAVRGRRLSARSGKRHRGWPARLIPEPNRKARPRVAGDALADSGRALVWQLRKSFLKIQKWLSVASTDGLRPVGAFRMDLSPIPFAHPASAQRVKPSSPTCSGRPRRSGRPTGIKRVVSLPALSVPEGSVNLSSVSAIDPEHDLLTFAISRPGGLAITYSGELRWLTLHENAALRPLNFDHGRDSPRSGP